MLGRGTAVEGQHIESPHEEKPSKREGSGALRRVGRPVGVRCGRVAVSVIDPAVSRSGENTTSVGVITNLEWSDNSRRHDAASDDRNNEAQTNPSLNL